jgi:hypothetical protein
MAVTPLFPPAQLLALLADAAVPAAAAAGGPVGDVGGGSGGGALGDGVAGGGLLRERERERDGGGSGRGRAAGEPLEEKRVRNDRIRTELGVRLRYPSYQEGVAAIHSGECWPLSPEDLRLLQL